MTNLVLSDVLPRPHVRSLRIVREATLITGFALLTAALAQVRIPLGFTPVPVTGQTLAVLLAGASLGAWRGASSQLLYWLLGMVGLPFYSNATSGWSVAKGIPKSMASHVAPNA